MTKEIQLTQGKVTLVDDDVYEWASKFKWCVNRIGRNWYAIRNNARGTKPGSSLLHREILNAPAEMGVDHINNDGLDNRRSNLRLASKIENARNMQVSSLNTSGFKGVVWNKQKNKWMARLSDKGKQIHLGFYVEIEDAARAYDEGARKYFGDFAKTNF